MNEAENHARFASRPTFGIGDLLVEDEKRLRRPVGH